MRVAIPIWRQRVSPVFDTAERLLVSNIENGSEASHEKHLLNASSSISRVDRLSELDVDVLICGAISQPLISMIGASGIKVIPWVAGNVDEVISWYLRGKPFDGPFLMPGSCSHRRRRRHQGTRPDLRRDQL